MNRESILIEHFTSIIWNCQLLKINNTNNIVHGNIYLFSFQEFVYKEIKDKTNKKSLIDNLLFSSTSLYYV
jgi:hypothetical protein